MLGRAHQERGDYETALEIFRKQLQSAGELGDRAHEAASHMSMAMLLAEQEEYAQALGYLDTAYRIDKTLGSSMSIGFDQMQRGRSFWALGRYAEARQALDDASSIAHNSEAGYKALSAWVYLSNAQMALSQRRFADAKTQGHKALTLAGKEYEDVTVQAKCCIGLAESQSGSHGEARRLCEEAVALARKIGSEPLLSSALLAEADTTLAGGDANGALEKVLQAQAMFARARQRYSEWRSWLVAARASEMKGDRPACMDQARRASRLLSELQAEWGAETFSSYVSRPDVQAGRKQIARILPGNR
jgi:tetratricopeptide (TPR) repeat protein